MHSPTDVPFVGAHRCRIDARNELVGVDCVAVGAFEQSRRIADQRTRRDTRAGNVVDKWKVALK